MKKLLLATAIFFASIGISQTVYIIDSPANICHGDSLKVSMAFTAPVTPNTNSIVVTISDATHSDIVWSKHYNEMYKLKKEPESAWDTLYSFKVLIPYYYSGQLKVDANGSYRFINMPGCPVGIEEYYLNQGTPIYFNLQGMPIDCRHNEVIIEQRGNYRRKVIITD